MNYLEDFFSLDKIIYAIIASIIGGILYFIIGYIAELKFSEIAFYIFTGFGFITGNIFKVAQLEKMREKEQKKLKREMRKFHNE